MKKLSFVFTLFYFFGGTLEIFAQKITANKWQFYVVSANALHANAKEMAEDVEAKMRVNLVGSHWYFGAGGAYTHFYFTENGEPKIIEGFYQIANNDILKLIDPSPIVMSYDGGKILVKDGKLLIIKQIQGIEFTFTFQKI